MLGKALLSLSALAQIVDSFFAGFKSHTRQESSLATTRKIPQWVDHEYGPRPWLTTIYFSHHSTSSKEDMFTTAIFGSLYWITGLSAILYPGSLAVDPEFGTGFPQLFIFGPLMVGSWVGAWVEGGLGAVKGKVA